MADVAVATVPEAPAAEGEEAPLTAEQQQIQNLRNNTIAPRSRSGYACASTMLIRYLFRKHPELLDPDFRTAFAPPEGEEEEDGEDGEEEEAQRRAAAAAAAAAPGGAGGATAAAQQTPAEVSRAAKAQAKAKKKAEAQWTKRVKAHLIQAPRAPHPLLFHLLTADAFFGWLLEVKKGPKGLSKAGAQSKRSALFNLYRDYHQEEQHRKLQSDLATLTKGLKRTIAGEKQEGNVEVREGKAPMPFALYRALAKAMLSSAVCENGHRQGAFGHPFLVLSWNLMCRATNCVEICLDHLEWKGDALCVYFGKQKGDQLGEKARHPRHVYANPIMPEICPVLALGVYLLSFGFEKNALFAGNNQYDRYCGFLRRTAAANSSILEGMGLTPEDLGTHSGRKGAASHVTSGSSAAPNPIAVQLRMGWSLPGVQGIYFNPINAADQYVGRAASGANISAKEFALLPPFFQRLKVDGTAKEGIEDVLAGAIVSCFRDVPLRLRKVAEFCLASVVYHAGFLRSTLQENHPLFTTQLFRDQRLLADLSEHVVLKYPDETDEISATGIPPHVVQLRQFQVVADSVASLGGKLEVLGQTIKVDLETLIRDVLEENAQASGTVTSLGVSRALQTTLDAAFSKSGLSDLLAAHQAGTLGLGEGSSSAPPSSSSCAGADQPPLYLYNGRWHTLPEHFEVPSFTVRAAWDAWMTGTPRLREFTTADVQGRAEKRRMSKFCCLMGAIESAAKEKGLWKDKPTLEEARSMFDAVKDAFDIKSRSDSHKRRFNQLVWTTVYILWSAQQADAKKRAKRARAKESGTGADESKEGDGGDSGAEDDEEGGGSSNAAAAAAAATGGGGAGGGRGGRGGGRGAQKKQRTGTGTASDAASAAASDAAAAAATAAAAASAAPSLGGLREGDMAFTCSYGCTKPSQVKLFLCPSERACGNLVHHMCTVEFCDSKGFVEGDFDYYCKPCMIEDGH